MPVDYSNDIIACFFVDYFYKSRFQFFVSINLKIFPGFKVKLVGYVKDSASFLCCRICTFGRVKSGESDVNVRFIFEFTFRNCYYIKIIVKCV